MRPGCEVTAPEATSGGADLDVEDALVLRRQAQRQAADIRCGDLHEWQPDRPIGVPHTEDCAFSNPSSRRDLAECRSGGRCHAANLRVTVPRDRGSVVPGADRRCGFGALQRGAAQQEELSGVTLGRDATESGRRHAASGPTRLSAMSTADHQGPSPAPGPWPVPARRTNERLLGALGWTIEVALGLFAGAGALSVSSAPARTLADIRAGGSASASAAIFGAASWCPAIPGTGMLRLTQDGATYDQGLRRRLPLDRLTAVAAHAPGTVSTAVRLPHRWWVLDLDGPAGAGSVAALPEELALLGGLAGWPPPLGWPVGEPAP